MLNPPGLFDRPLLGDVLKGLGLAVLFAAVAILPPWLVPWHVLRWWYAALMALALWFMGFMLVRQHRQWAAEDAARAARRDAGA
jgi:hypothetical protein